MVIGYREWVMIGDELLSPLARRPWTPGIVTAECLTEIRGARGLWREPVDHDGPAPDPGCVCGIYALFEPARVRVRGRERMTVARGAVVLSGRIELHRRGMRAEFAEVVALSFPRDKRAAAAVARTAERYGVRAVPAPELRGVALAHGSEVDPELIPDRPAVSPRSRRVFAQP